MVTNKRIKTTESLQKRFFNGSKNLVIEIEKLIYHHSVTKKNIKNENTIIFLVFFAVNVMIYCDFVRFVV